MKTFRRLIALFFLVCAGCSGFQTKIEPETHQKTPTPIPATPRPVENIQPKSIANLDTLQSPTIFSTTWNNPARYLVSLDSTFHEQFPDWLPLSEYLIDVTISSDLKKIDGKEEILVVNRTDQILDSIAFHNYPALFGSTVEITQVTVNGTDTAPIFESDMASFSVPLANAIHPSEAVVIALHFSYTMPMEATSNYLIFGTSPGLITLAHFYPMVAAFDGYGWHTETPPNYGDVTYSDAALYQVRVRTPKSILPVASGTQIQSGKEGGIDLREFVIGPARDFYLAAGKGLKTEKESFGERIVQCTAHPAYMSGCKPAIEVTENALEFFSERIGPYPYTELDIVATHTEALGVEYPGAIAINRNLFDIDPTQPGDERAKYFNSTLVHEVGHQWFYNLIGNDQVNHPWLDESTTQYLTYLYYDQSVGNLAGEQMLQSFHNRVNRVEDTTQPIGLPVKAYDGNEYGAIIYGRGPLFFYELEQTYGSNVMSTFLTEMYKDYLWKNIQSPDIEDTLEKACACELSEPFQEWVGEEP